MELEWGVMCISFHRPLSWDLQGSLSQGTLLGVEWLVGLGWGHFQGMVMGKGAMSRTTQELEGLSSPGVQGMAWQTMGLSQPPLPCHVTLGKWLNSLVLHFFCKMG